MPTLAAKLAADKKEFTLMAQSLDEALGIDPRWGSAPKGITFHEVRSVCVNPLFSIIERKDKSGDLTYVMECVVLDKSINAAKRMTTSRVVSKEEMRELLLMAALSLG
jgi:hypothetical protein